MEKRHLHTHTHPISALFEERWAKKEKAQQETAQIGSTAQSLGRRSIHTNLYLYKLRFILGRTVSKAR
jgi:hypothetical protein